MLLDYQGRELTRAKHFGFGPRRGPAFIVAPAAAEIELVDAIASERIPIPTDDDEHDEAEAEE